MPVVAALNGIAVGGAAEITLACDARVGWARSDFLGLIDYFVGSGEECLWLTLNGAVDRVIARGPQRIRVGLSGPGRALGHAAVREGATATTVDRARERAVLLALPASKLVSLGQDAFARVVLDALQRELAVALREAERPQARLAATRARA